MKLYIVRHAESEGNVRGVMQGHLDLPLTAQGEQQALGLRQWLTRQDICWQAAYVSPLTRARQTAALLVPDGPVQVDADLQEIFAGRLEGLTYAEMCAQYPGYRERTVMQHGDFSDYDGEAYEAVQARVARFRETLESRHRRAEDSVLIVSHGGILFQLIKQLVCLPVPRFANLRLGNCSVTHVAMRERRGTYVGEIVWHLPPELMN